LAHGDFGLQFYAGAPLRILDGFNIGVLTVADRLPRKITNKNKYMLEGLAADIMEELEERKSV
jgi:GAF domain-containing protein